MLDTDDLAAQMLANLVANNANRDAADEAKAEQEAKVKPSEHVLMDVEGDFDVVEEVDNRSANRMAGGTGSGKVLIERDLVSSKGLPFKRKYWKNADDVQKGDKLLYSTDAQGWNSALTPFQLGKQKAALKFAVKKKLLVDPSIAVPGHVLRKLGMTNKEELVKSFGSALVKPQAVVKEEVWPGIPATTTATGDSGKGLTPFQLGKQKAALKFAMKKLLLKTPTAPIPDHVLQKLGVKDKAALVASFKYATVPIPKIPVSEVSKVALGLVAATGGASGVAATVYKASVAPEKLGPTVEPEAQFFEYLASNLKDPKHIDYWQKDYVKYVAGGMKPTFAAAAVHGYLSAKVPGLPKPPVLVDPVAVSTGVEWAPITHGSPPPSSIKAGQDILKKLGPLSTTLSVLKAFGASHEASSVINEAVSSWSDSQVSPLSCEMRFAAATYVAGLQGRDPGVARSMENIGIGKSTSYATSRPAQATLDYMEKQPPPEYLTAGLRAMARASQAAHAADADSDGYITLYRGMKMSEAQYAKALATGVVPSNAMTSFTTKSQTAKAVGGPYVFTSRVHLSQIAASHKVVGRLRTEAEVIVFTNNNFTFKNVIHNNYSQGSSFAKEPAMPGDPNWKAVEYDKLAGHDFEPS